MLHADRRGACAPQFGGSFRHLHSSNTLVVVEALDDQPIDGSKLLRWSFGKSLAREVTLRGSHAHRTPLLLLPAA